MDHPVTFARHFARLVWLLVHDAPNVDEQKATLRALAMVAKEAPVALTANDEQLGANGTAVSTAFAGVTDVLQRLDAHGLRAIEVEVTAGPAELLGVARLLAGAHVANDFGVAAEAQRAALGATGVRFKLKAPPGALPDLELVDVVDGDAAAAPRRARLSAADVAPRGDGGGGGLFGQFKPARTPGSPQALLAELAATTDDGRLDHILDDLTAIVEAGGKETRGALVSEILYGIVRRESVAVDAQEKRVLAMAVRRLAKAPVLQAVATQLPRAPERRAELMAVLVRTGEDGADALIEQVASASQQSDRRVYFDALLELQAGIPTLIHMLGDTRWFVARNAADLLGEMQAREAEQPLTWLLQHADDRVRRAGTGALMRLGTPRALQAIHDALKDGAPQMRMQAAAALAARKDVRTAATLIRALDEEKDDEVQEAFLLALGRLATTDAVQRLLVAAEPERGFFKKKPSSLRVAAIQALAEARTADAILGLTGLLADKEQEVKDAASFALGRINRAPTSP